MNNKIEFINHCEDEMCDLGYAEFICPNCNILNNNYDNLWWERFNYEFIVDTNCNSCKNKLIAMYNNYEWKIFSETLF